jgi:hypothetical protein
MPASSCPCRRRQNLRNFQPVPNVSPVVSSSRARRQLRSAVRSAPTIDMQGRNCECPSSTVIRGRQARTQGLAMSPSTIATFLVGSRAVSHRNTASVRTKPPISFRSDTKSVDTSSSGGRKRIRTMRGLSAKINSKPTSAAKLKTDLGVYAAHDLVARARRPPSRFQRLYFRECQMERELPSRRHCAIFLSPDWF